MSVALYQEQRNEKKKINSQRNLREKYFWWFSNFLENCYNLLTKKMNKNTVYVMAELWGALRNIPRESFR